MNGLPLSQGPDSTDRRRPLHSHASSTSRRSQELDLTTPLKPRPDERGRTPAAIRRIRNAYYWYLQYIEYI